MLNKLAQIANKLDGLGLAKEADILDKFIWKIAGFGEDAAAGRGKEQMAQIMNEDCAREREDSPDNVANRFVVKFLAANPGYNRDDASLLGSYLYTYVYKPGIHGVLGYASADSMVGWEKYISQTPGRGDRVQKAWASYARAVGASSSFSAFVKWWKGKKAARSFSDGGGGISAVVAELARDVEIHNSGLFSHNEGESSFDKTKQLAGTAAVPEENRGQAFPAPLDGQKTGDETPRETIKVPIQKYSPGESLIPDPNIPVKHISTQSAYNLDGLFSKYSR